MNAFPGERTDLMSPRECEDGASVISRGPANFLNRRPSRRTETNAGTGEFRAGSCVQDVERGVMPGINPLPWQTDTSIGDWFHAPCTLSFT